MRKSVSPLPGIEGDGSASTTRVFGVPLEEVTRTHTVSGQQVPALVKHIVDYIEEHGQLDLEGLFLVNGNAERVDWLRQRYDSGEEVELEKEADLASAVSLLRLFLQELPEPSEGNSDGIALEIFIPKTNTCIVIAGPIHLAAADKEEKGGGCVNYESSYLSAVNVCIDLLSPKHRLQQRRRAV
ncbi:hypothetical protein GOODEAATRI_003455 [Goodea atripinnis]|uniref:Rho-GAP domain-containing protein n=1 Tax=Goodea atripinnis TaxID=208336 RepID=A0ABV0NRG5_9TELE